MSIKVRTVIFLLTIIFLIFVALASNMNEPRFLSIAGLIAISVITFLVLRMIKKNYLLRTEVGLLTGNEKLQRLFWEKSYSASTISTVMAVVNSYKYEDRNQIANRLYDNLKIKSTDEEITAVLEKYRK